MCSKIKALILSKYYLWGTVKDKCYTDKPDTIDALKDNIREAIGEIQLHTIDNVLQNWIDRVGLLHGQPGYLFYLFIYFIL